MMCLLQQIASQCRRGEPGIDKCDHPGEPRVRPIGRYVE